MLAHVFVNRAEILIDTPYNAAFVTRLKHSVPASRRRWDPATKRWAVNLDYQRVVTDLCSEYFEDVMVHSHDGVHHARTDHDALFVRPDAPPVVVDAAYRSLARAHHPDVNHAPDAARVMQQINRTYARLKGGRS